MTDRTTARAQAEEREADMGRLKAEIAALKAEIDELKALLREHLDRCPGATDDMRAVVA